MFGRESECQSILGEKESGKKGALATRDHMEEMWEDAVDIGMGESIGMC